MSQSSAQRIHSLIESARSRSSAQGRELDVAGIFITVLVRCGICREDATRLVADNDRDPVASILHYAGDSHNFAVLAVEEALAAA
jgi:hypothetical protein